MQKKTDSEVIEEPEEEFDLDDFLDNFGSSVTSDEKEEIKHHFPRFNLRGVAIALMAAQKLKSLARLNRSEIEKLPSVVNMPKLPHCSSGEVNIPMYHPASLEESDDFGPKIRRNDILL